MVTRNLFLIELKYSTASTMIITLHENER
jgi:hypothetical protein